MFVFPLVVSLLVTFWWDCLVHEQDRFLNSFCTCSSWELCIFYFTFMLMVYGKCLCVCICVYVCVCVCVCVCVYVCVVSISLVYLHLYLWQQLGVGIGILYYVLYTNLERSYYKLTICYIYLWPWSNWHSFSPSLHYLWNVHW